MLVCVALWDRDRTLSDEEQFRSSVQRLNRHEASCYSAGIWTLAEGLCGSCELSQTRTLLWVFFSSDHWVTLADVMCSGPSGCLDVNFIENRIFTAAVWTGFIETPGFDSVFIEMSSANKSSEFKWTLLKGSGWTVLMNSQASTERLYLNTGCEQRGTKRPISFNWFKKLYWQLQCLQSVLFYYSSGCVYGGYGTVI